MSTVDVVSTPNQKNTRSKALSSPATEISKNTSSSGKRSVTTPRDLVDSNDDDLLADMDDDNGFEAEHSAQASSENKEPPSDESVEVSDAPLVGQSVLIRLAYTHPKMEPDNKTGIRVELIVQDRLKHIGFNDLKLFLNEMGRNFFHPADVTAPPVLCREINGYPIPKTDKICMFGKILCKPDFFFLKRLFTKAAQGSVTLCCVPRPLELMRRAFSLLLHFLFEVC